MSLKRLAQKALRTYSRSRRPTGGHPHSRTQPSGSGRAANTSKASTARTAIRQVGKLLQRV
ncbi:hypothetical protein P1J78_24610 [Psychromarinibacter sp. C21-152]|uniref:Uncharacterized protein n=1 Tax=Psychromarinibacter sediminicola TaxID=3033385 RepID=A0AAE3NZQ2_9RHOB|nr:hypothetical protein [Psychromarinibacter sediminicola]MDF0603900.1 hypothetical protein [Psychromarinibacter sediminicola]